MRSIISFLFFSLLFCLPYTSFSQTDQELLLNAQHAYEGYGNYKKTLEILSNLSSAGRTKYLYLALMGKAYDGLHNENMALQYYQLCLQANPGDLDIASRIKAIEDRRALIERERREQEERIQRQRDAEEKQRRMQREAELQRQIRQEEERQMQLRRQQEEEERKRREAEEQKLEYERRVREMAFWISLQYGLGADNIPMIVNDQFNHTTTSVGSFHPVGEVGTDIGILDNKGVSVRVKPWCSYGSNFLNSDIVGNHFTYGAMGTLYLSKKFNSDVRFFAEGALLRRKGKWDASTSDIATSSIIRQSAQYDYGVTRYGAGFMINFSVIGYRTYIKPGIAFESLSYFSRDRYKPLMIANLQVMVGGSLVFDFAYGKNYAISGTADYPEMIAPENQDFYSIRLLMTSKLVR